MVNALVLYTDGKREVKDVKDVNDLEEYQKIVGGSIERLCIPGSYYNPQKKSHSLVTGFVNDEGMVKDLPTNPYAGILSLLGVELCCGLFIYGNVILFSATANGGKRAIDPYVVKLFDDYEACEDDDDFFCEMEALNKTPKEKKPKKKDASLPSELIKAYANENEFGIPMVKSVKSKKQNK